jgi:hypothetical protein
LGKGLSTVRVTTSPLDDPLWDVDALLLGRLNTTVEPWACGAVAG